MGIMAAIFIGLMAQASQQSHVLKCASLLKTDHKIKSFDDLFYAFSNGFIPDLNNKTQRYAFELYLRLRFGDPRRVLETDNRESLFDVINRELQKYPELKKESFRSYVVEIQEKTYPVTPELKLFIERLLKGTNQVRNNLFQMDANLGYWKKIFQWQDMKVDSEKNEFLVYLDNIISSEHRAQVADSQIDEKIRARILMKQLLQSRDLMSSQGKDIRPISQAIVDLIHVVGFHGELMHKDLKSNDGMVRFHALKNVLEERDSFARELGFNDGFDGVLKHFNVLFPTGVESSQMIPQALPKIEVDLESKVQIIKNDVSSKIIRHLSLLESPFRALLGGGLFHGKISYTGP